jgi:hypothetical protein
MPHDLSRRTLESLKKEAKRWLSALDANDPGARARLNRALENAPAQPTLRDVQLALAREHGFAGWTALKDALSRDRPGSVSPTLDEYQTMAQALLEAYQTGTTEAMERHYHFTWHRRAWPGMRTYVQLDLGKRPAIPGGDVEITIDDALQLVANEHGFRTWTALSEHVATMTRDLPMTAKPMRVSSTEGLRGSRPRLISRDWTAVLRQLSETRAAGLDASGVMTDTMLRDVARIDDLDALDLNGCKRVTDDGLRHLARLSKLRSLKLGGTGITDRGLALLREWPQLEHLELWGTAITDDGVRALAHCRALRDVNLMGTHAGDSAIRALAGMPELRSFKSGVGVTDEGLAMLHDLPVFKTWHGGEVEMGLTSYDAAPNQLALRGPFTDRGMQHLRGLDGLFGLNLDDSHLSLTAAAMAPLVTLPHLGWLAVDARDDWMPYIAEMPQLRFLGAQDTVAGDDGFVALSRSRSIEYIWGRRCHNLRRRGFVALADMPALRSLSVSCLNVDDAGVSALPRFPALRELMPMDVPDAGYRHIGRCTELDSLVLMYCRDTTDVATGHLVGLPKLRSYFNSYTAITDRTPQLLSRIDSLERVCFSACHQLTNAGVAALARLPRLQEIDVSGIRLTAELKASFPSHVAVQVSDGL